MEISKYVTIVLKASEGHMLTEVNAKDEFRTLADTVYLADGANVDEWTEISEEEAEVIRQIQEEFLIQYENGKILSRE